MRVPAGDPAAPATTSRRSVVIRAVELGGLVAAGAAGGQGYRVGAAPASPVPPDGQSGLAHAGVNYDTGWNSYPGYLTRQIWSDAVMRHDLGVIRDDLHCTAIGLYGTEIDRLVPATAVAVDQGMRVWVQPRLINATSEQTVEHVAALAAELEPIRANGGDIGLNVGCELTLFMDGIFPGNSFEERVSGLIAAARSGDFTTMAALLNDHLGRAAAAARTSFGGLLTYSAGMWEAPGIDWPAFDVIGIDAYRDAKNAATYVQGLRAAQEFDIPVVVTEFGCCTWNGAADAGGSGYDIVDWEQDVPVLKGDYTRDEQEQVDYTTELFDVFENERGIHEAYVYTFIEEMPYSPEPAYDLDLASFGIVRMVVSEGEEIDPEAYWEPKAAFHALAERFASSEATPAGGS